MGRLKIEIVYMWQMFSIYMNIKRFAVEFLVGTIAIAAVILAYGEYFLLVLLPLWFLFPVITLSVQWRLIRAERDRILEQAELQESYPLFYNRFTNSK